MEFLGPVPRPSASEWAATTPHDVAVTQLQQYAGHVRSRQANGATQAEIDAMLVSAGAIADRIEQGTFGDLLGRSRLRPTD